MKQNTLLFLVFLSGVIVTSVLFLVYASQTIKDVPEHPAIITSTTTQSDVVTSSRRTVARTNLDELDTVFPNACDRSPASVSFYDPETEWVSYLNKEKGIEMEIPYNSAWGAPLFVLNPFDVDGARVLFGPVGGAPEGCGSWTYSYRLNFLDAKSPSQLIAHLEDKNGKVKTLPKYMQITTTTINGLDVLEYTLDGMCGGGEVIVFGKKANYSFSTLCSGLMREDIISKIKLIE